MKGVALVTMIPSGATADTRHPDLVQLGAAHPNVRLATMALNRTLASVARRMGYRTGMYDYVPGCEALRVQIAQRALSSGCRLGPDDVVITTGCTESISLCLRAVCHPGDTVAIESPTGFDALLSLDVLGLQALEIPTHPRDGMSLDALRFALDHHPVSACLVVSNYNNPLGSCIPDDNKRELVALLASHNIPLIENDVFGEIHFQDRRPSVAKAYDDKGLVMLCSSFSKSLCPGYRVGWVVPGRFMASIRWLKYTTSLASPTLSEYAIAEFLASGATVAGGKDRLIDDEGPEGAALGGAVPVGQGDMGGGGAAGAVFGLVEGGVDGEVGRRGHDERGFVVQEVALGIVGVGAEEAVADEIGGHDFRRRGVVDLSLHP